MADLPPPAPDFAVANACMAFVDAIIARKSLMSIDEARATGRDLYTWFDENGGLTARKSPFAVLCTESGTTTVTTNKSQSIDDVIKAIKDDFEHYAA